MKTRFVALAISGCLALPCVSGQAQDSAARSTAAAPGSAKAGGQEFNYGLGDLMTTLIQPRHLKLYYAGTQGNWELAAAESRALRSGLARISQSIPKYLDIGVPQTIATIFSPKLQDLDASIAAADSKQFNAKYRDLTAACNSCHVFMEHPFIVIKVPELSAGSIYPDQDFGPTP
jgi:hypothetical protein